MNKKKLKALFFFMLIPLILISVIILQLNTKTPLYLAIVGPMSGDDAQSGLSMVEGAQLYINQVNANGGIHGNQVELITYDDQNNTELAINIAQELQQNDNILGILGHYSSPTSYAAGPIYKDKGIPVITGSATADDITIDNDWSFRVTFNNSDQGALIANYIYKMLGVHQASIIYDRDKYGSTLFHSFKKAAKEIGLEVNNVWSFDADSLSDKKLDDVGKTMKEESQEAKQFLVLATHSSEAVRVITRNQLSRTIPIMGGDALATSNFLHRFKSFPQERAKPGYYTDGIYFTAPYLPSLAGQSAKEFSNTYLDIYNKEPDITASKYYDAAKVLLTSASKAHLENYITIKQKRRAIRDQLWKINSLEQAFDGVAGYFYFDGNGDAVKANPVGIYKQAHSVPAWLQYEPLNNIDTDNLLEKFLNHEVVKINNKFMQKSRVVFVGLDFNEIGSLDTKKSLFTADFYLWFRYKEDFDVPNIDFVNLENPNYTLQKEEFSKRYSATGKIEDTLIIRNYRIKTKFKGQFDFHDYPFDKQILPISFRHKKLTKESLIYVVDTVGMGIANKHNAEILANYKRKNVFSTGGWKINEVLFFINNKQNDSTWGLPELFDSPPRIEYSQFNAHMEIERYALSYIIKNLLPIIFIVALGYSVYYTREFGTKMTLSINMMLVTSLFHLKLGTTLSNVEYNVLIEYIFYAIYMLAIFGIIYALFFNIKSHTIKEIKSKISKLKESLIELKLDNPATFKQDKSVIDRKITPLKQQVVDIQESLLKVTLTGRYIYPMIIFSMALYVKITYM